MFKATKYDWIRKMRKMQEGGFQGTVEEIKIIDYFMCCRLLREF